MSMHVSKDRPQVNAGQHQAAAWLPHPSTLHMYTPTAAIHTNKLNTFIEIQPSFTNFANHSCPPWNDLCSPMVAKRSTH